MTSVNSPLCYWILDSGSAFMFVAFCWKNSFKAEFTLLVSLSIQAGRIRCLLFYFCCFSPYWYQSIKLKSIYLSYLIHSDLLYCWRLGEAYSKFFLMVHVVASLPYGPSDLHLLGFVSLCILSHIIWLLHVTTRILQKRRCVTSDTRS